MLSLCVARSIWNSDGPKTIIFLCMQMFLPMHEDKAGGHWFLMVVDLEKKVAEVWDSLPTLSSASSRWDHALTTVTKTHIFTLTIRCK